MAKVSVLGQRPALLPWSTAPRTAYYGRRGGTLLLSKPLLTLRTDRQRRGIRSRRGARVSAKSDEQEPLRGACCPPDSEPYLAPPVDYTPTGETVTVTGGGGSAMRVYVVGEAPVGILVAHDIFGGDSGRHKQLCDALAESSGYVVAMPDLFHDSFSSEEREIKLWKVPGMLPSAFAQITRKWTPEEVLGDVQSAVQLLHTRGASRVGLLGFCYGAWVVMRASGEPQELPGIACGVSVHPSVHNICRIGLGGASEEAIVRGVTCPQLVLSTRSEPTEWRSGGQVSTWLAEATDSSSAVVDLPPSLAHGFATRGDTGKEDVREGVRHVVTQALAFFDQHLKQGS